MLEEHSKTGEVHIHYHIHLDDQLIIILKQLLTTSANTRLITNTPTVQPPVQQLDPTVVMGLVEKFVGAISRDRDRDDSREERSRYRP